jgi:hypothetical protein
MKIYFSGGTGLKETPEALIKDRRPHIMLTFHTLSEGDSGAVDRLKAYIRRKEKEKHENKP